MKRILVVRTDRVGDVVMITPMLRELKKKFPDAYLGALTNDKSAAVLHHNPHLDTLITDDLNKGSFWKTVQKIRSHHFTEALLVWPAERAAYQLLLAGIPRRVGVGHKLYEMLTFMKNVNRDYNPPLHEAQYCMDLARAIGVTTDNLTPELYISQPERDWARAYLRELGIPDSSYIVVIHSGCRKTSPNWSEGKYFQLITAMLQKDTSRRVHVLLTALEMSYGFLQQIAALKDNRIHDISPEIGPLRKLISVLGASNALVASSTGPLHLASGLGVKTVGIFCRRPLFRAARWGALGPMAVNLDVSEEYSSAHCRAHDDQCAFENGISVEDVLEHLDI